MKVNFLAFGFCVGMAVSSFIDKEISTGIIQLFFGCANIPWMLSTEEE